MKLKFGFVIGITILLAGCKGKNTDHHNGLAGISLRGGDVISKSQIVFPLSKEDFILKFEDSKKKLAAEFWAIAEDVGIDPVILWALAQNSTPQYCSDAQACGMLKITPIAVKEFNDHLDGAYLNHSKDVKSFLDQLLHEEAQSFVRKNFVKLITTKDNHNVVVQKNPTASHIYGAVIFKIYLAKSLDKNKNKSIFEGYNNALDMYNGSRDISGKINTNYDCFANQIAKNIDLFFADDRRFISEVKQIAGNYCNKSGYFNATP